MFPFFTLIKPNKKSYDYVWKTGLLWLTFNLIIISTFALIYKYYDSGEKSIFKGLQSEKQRSYSDYFYFSIIINTTLGLGEIVPLSIGDHSDPDFIRSKSLSRKLVAIHIMTSLLFNDMLDSFENIKLA